MSDLRVGIIGFGGAGIGHVYYFSQIPGCRVVAVFDPKSAALERAQQHRLNNGWLVTDDLSLFLNHDIDIVSVCTPDSTHKDYILAGLAAGKNVLCEKPLAASLEDCQQIIRAAEASQQVCAVLHQMRFVPLYRRIKESVSAGEVGNVSYLEGYYVHDLTQRAGLYDDWRFQENATPLVYSGCHFVDLLRWLAAEEVVEVAAFANHIAFPAYPESDCNVLLMRFQSGRIGKVVTAFGAKRPQDHSVRVYGDQASIDNNLVMDQYGVRRVLHRPILFQWEKFERSSRPSWRRVLAFLRMSQRSLGAVLHSRLDDIARRMLPTGPEYSIQSVPVRTYEHQLACIRGVRNFVEAVRGGSPPLCSVIESARTVAVCLAGVAAYRTRQVQQVRDFWFPELDDPRP